VIAMVVFTIWVSGPVPPKGSKLLATDQIVIGKVTSNPYRLSATATSTTSPELFTRETEQPVDAPEEASDQASTSGILIGTTAVVLIVILGTLFSIWQSRDRSPKKKK